MTITLTMNAYAISNTKVKILSYRQKQAKRGQQAVEMLAAFLEQQHGILTVSINESGYSTGQQYIPDMIFMNYAIEVKRIEFLTTTKSKSKDDMYTVHINDLKVNSESWLGMQKFCKLHKKIPVLVAVLTWGRQPPLFIGFTKQQIDAYQLDCKDRPAAQPEYTPEGEPYYPHHKSTSYVGYFFGTNSWRLLQEGINLNQPNNFHTFFSCLKHSTTCEVIEKTLKVFHQ